MSDEVERQLAARLRAGDRAALAPLFDCYRERLRRVVRYQLDIRLTNRVSDSDVVQEIFLCASQRLDHYLQMRTPLTFFSWLRMLAAQHVIDLYRHHAARKRDLRRDISLHRGVAQPSSMALAHQLVSPVTSPSEALARLELLARLEKTLQGLTHRDREVVVLRHYAELSNTEAAEVLGIEPAAASKRYVRAMKRLRAALGAGDERQRSRGSEKNEPKVVPNRHRFRF